MSCEEASEITAWLHGEGSEAERAALKRHYDACRSCAAELALFQKTAGALRSLRIEPSPDFADRVEAALPRPRLRLLPGLSLAAAALLALTVLFVLRKPEDRTRVGHLAPEPGELPALPVAPDLPVHAIGADWTRSLAYDARLLKAAASRSERPDVRKAAQWLASKQAPDGSWKGANEGETVEGTGLASMACAAGGEDAAARRGLKFLEGRQRDSGVVGGGSPVSHAVATLALLEGGSDRAAGAALAVIATQNRERPWGDGEIAAWQFQALRFAEALGDERALPALKSGRAAAASAGAAGRAASLRARLWADPSPDLAAWARESAWLMEVSPILGTTAANYAGNDLGLAWFGSQLLRPLGGDAWTKWWGPLEAKLQKTQLPDGSWPAGFEPGRAAVPTVALAALILDVPRRVPPLEE